MGKYTSLTRRVEEVEPQERGATAVSNILDVNINNIHSNSGSSLIKPTPALPKDTLQCSPPVEMSHSVASSDKQGEDGREEGTTNLRTTNLTNLTGPTAVRCIHGTTEDRCAVCSGYARWLIADEVRLQRARSNPDEVRREFWREVGE